MLQLTGTAQRPELFFAFVGPAGTRLEDLSNRLQEQLTTFGYKTLRLRLSEQLENFVDWTTQKGQGEYDRIKHHQEMGTKFRQRLCDGAALARAGIAEIRSKRASISGNPDLPAHGHAFFLHQLKHPDEVDLLRDVYANSFYLLAAHAPRDSRVAKLAGQMAQKDLLTGQEWRYQGKALEIIGIDEKEENDYGQNTRDAYPRADFFANLAESYGENEVERFLALVFGHPFHTPSRDEYAMYQASAASLRSSDDNRQVGAAIVTLLPNGSEGNSDVVAVGLNEVPCRGGGAYWEKESPDARDQALLYHRGAELARDIKISALAELIEKIQKKGWLNANFAQNSSTDLARLLIGDIKRTQFMEIGEFSRPVHAEMAALIDSARRGVAVNGHAMYVTTFPCHNCAKHIIAAGIRKVVYLEPYPKSRAGILHGDEIVLESKDGKIEDKKVVFVAFTGIAPRQYAQLFSMSARGGRKGMILKDWIAARQTLIPQYAMRNAALAYLAAERQELEKLPVDIYRWNADLICPRK